MLGSRLAGKSNALQTRQCHIVETLIEIPTKYDALQTRQFHTVEALTQTSSNVMLCMPFEIIPISPERVSSSWFREEVTIEAWMYGVMSMKLVAAQSKA